MISLPVTNESANSGITMNGGTFKANLQFQSMKTLKIFYLSLFQINKCLAEFITF